MPISLVWDDAEKRVLRYDIEGRWMWDEMFKAFDEGAALMKDIDYTVNFIVNPLDAPARNYIPPNSLGNTIRMYNRALPNAGVTVLITTNPTVTTLLRLLTTLNPRIAARYMVAESLEVAREKLALKLKGYGS